MGGNPILLNWCLEGLNGSAFSPIPSFLVYWLFSSFMPVGVHTSIPSSTMNTLPYRFEAQLRAFWDATSDSCFSSIQWDWLLATLVFRPDSTIRAWSVKGFSSLILTGYFNSQSSDDLLSAWVRLVTDVWRCLMISRCLLLV